MKVHNVIVCFCVDLNNIILKNIILQDIQGCCCVNPGRLTKGLTGSTFARVVIQVNNLQSNQSVVPNIAAQVVRI